MVLGGNSSVKNHYLQQNGHPSSTIKHLPEQIQRETMFRADHIPKVTLTMPVTLRKNPNSKKQLLTICRLTERHYLPTSAIQVSKVAKPMTIWVD